MEMDPLIPPVNHWINCHGERKCRKPEAAAMVISETKAKRQR